MTVRQRVLRWIYPLFVTFKKLTGKNKIVENNSGRPQFSFYDLSAWLNNGNKLEFSRLKGKKVLIVNTASNCGYTSQYSELQQLYEEQKRNLVILGFPANDFKEQEKGTDEEIASFCKINYGVTFPLIKKSVVIKGPEQNSVFQWLTDKNRNGWNERQPTWNFSKYLINEEGVLTHYFDPAVSPLDEEVLKAINE